MNLKFTLFVIIINLATVKAYENQAIVVFEGNDRSNHSWDWTANNINFATTGIISAYDANYIEVEDFIIINDLDATQAFKITATHNGWSQLPVGYSGNKTSVSGDIQLMVEDENGMTAYSAYDGSYELISNSGTDYILKSTTSVNNASADINARILMDWVNDVKGNYSMSITLTVSNL